MAARWKNDEARMTSAVLPAPRARLRFELILGVALWALLAGVLLWIGAV